MSLFYKSKSGVGDYYFSRKIYIQFLKSGILWLLIEKGIYEYIAPAAVLQ